VVSNLPHNLAVYEIIGKHITQPGRPQMMIWRMHIACWIPKATNINSEYVIPITFPLQQRLRERAPTLRCRNLATVLPVTVGPVAVGITNGYGLDGLGIESHWGARFLIHV
jgi:hypothetical protein